MVQDLLSDESRELTRKSTDTLPCSGAILAFFVVPLAITAIDAAIGPAPLYTRRPELYPVVWAETFALFVRLTWVPLSAHALSTALAMSGLPPRLVVGVQGLLGGAVAIHLVHLTQLRAPLVLPVIAVGPLFVVTPLLAHLVKLRPRLELASRIVGVALVLGGLAALGWCYVRYSERYLNVSAAVLDTVIAVWLLCGVDLVGRDRTARSSVLVAAATAAALLLALGAALKPTHASSAVARAYTAFGRAATRLDEPPPSTPVPVIAAARTSAAPDASVVAEFVQRAGLPPVSAPTETPLNVLLITSEATRFDRTGLARGRSQGTTPALAAFAKAGAYSFTRAQSPSHVTLQSMSAIHTVSFPFATPLNVWDVIWHGELRSEATTIAEVLSAAGYRTWMASHSNRAISCCILGFDQGFQEKRWVSKDPKDKVEQIDRDLADTAIANIQRLARENRPFFGWVFLGSPHSTYEVRYSDMPSKTPAERYLHDLRYMDEQFGRILGAIRENGIEDKTVVVYTSDHGEELEDRGALGHLTLHEECVHVPLLVRIPNTNGAEISVPMSSINGIAWALLQASPAARAFAEQRIRQLLIPLLRAAGSPSAYTEVISPEGSSLSLVKNGTRSICNLARDWCELYDLHSDPGARVDLRREDPSFASSSDAALHAIVAIRKEQARYRFVDRSEPAKRLLRF